MCPFNSVLHMEGFPMMTPEVERIMNSIDEETAVPKLMLYAIEKLGVAPCDTPALVQLAIAEILRGHHHHHFRRRLSLFSSLCAVLKTVLAAQREPKRA